MIIFDLPTIESYERKEYRTFRTALIKQGFIMIQFSVYVRSYNRQINVSEELNKLIPFLPSGGNIRGIAVTECQWQNMVIMIGDKDCNEIINDTERYKKI